MEVKKAPLSPSTPEFAFLEYGLQLSLRSSTARIVSAHVISNPHVSVQFEKRCKDILCLNSWIDASQLVGGNTEDEVIRRGFQFSSGNQGMKVSVGVMRQSPIASAAAPSVGREMPTTRKILLCKVGIGRARVADEITAERETIPEQYDSFYVKQSNEVKSEDDYHHEYIIKNSAQILPLYLVHFEFDPKKEKASREKAKCDNCETEVATIYCSSDSANLCNKCDSQLHTSKLSLRHIRSPIGKGSDVFGHCRHHQDKLIEFYCAQCHIPVCVFCKMVGNHANGEASKHQLVSVSEAYQTVLQEAGSFDPVLQSRRTEIVNQIAAVNHRAKAVEKMGLLIEGQIEDMYKRAMSELHMILRDKINVLLGDEMELKRQLGEIEHLEEFLKYQQQGDATQFLFSWARHQQYRAELHDFKFFRNEIDVELDVKVTGNISVVTDGATHPTPVVTGSAPTKKPLVKQSSSSSVVNPGAPNAGMVGLGLPRKIQDRRIQRRTSDFFAESLAMSPGIGWSGNPDGDEGN
ncbi:hypothetical protein HDU76_012036 [Blyttiomyces sp. JEL0837]|nr:hypothetical protein HDU76_012036 [Blyttiomyces sp. JEL0837]